MRSQTDLLNYQEQLAHHRDQIKASILNLVEGTNEYSEALSMFYRLDGAIQLINWALEQEQDTAYALPPLISPPST